MSPLHWIPHPGEKVSVFPKSPSLGLGPFSLVPSSGPDHPSGMIAALASRDAGDPGTFFVLVDVATGDEVLRRERVIAQFVTTTEGAIVTGYQDGAFAKLTWLDLRGQPTGAKRSMRVGMGALVGLFGFDDRLVVVTQDSRAGTTQVQLLDSKGAELSTSVCHAAYLGQTWADLGRIGDAVIFHTHPHWPKTDTQGICRVYLHGAPRLREATLPQGEIAAEGGRMYLRAERESAWKALNEDLEVGDVTPFPAVPRCWGLTEKHKLPQLTVGDVRIFAADTGCCWPGVSSGMVICRPDRANEEEPAARP
jgi:hypothetical protein